MGRCSKVGLGQRLWGRSYDSGRCQEKTGMRKEAPDTWRVGRISWCGYGFVCSRPDAMLMFIPQDFWIDPDAGNDMQTVQ